MLSVQVWDKTMVKAVEKAVMNAGLGLNPIVDGQLVRVPIPELNEERREELSRVAGRYAEEARVAVRNVRRDGMDKLKRMEKGGELSQDDHHLWGDEVQSLTDDHVAKIDELLETKQQDIMQV
jgi:ribosome recycling factor